MTKAELIERLAGRKDLPKGLTKKAIGQLVDAVFVEIGDYFIRARISRSNPPRLTYPGFGTFAKRRKSQRTVRNPQTGAPILIPPQTTVTFTPGQELKALMNQVPAKRAASTAQAARAGQKAQLAEREAQQSTKVSAVAGGSSAPAAE